MRKLIVSMNITLDGYISGPDCELDWHFESWTRDMGMRLTEELSRADTILLGRVTYQVMARYWPAKEAEISCGHDRDFAAMMNRYHKIAFSNTLREAGWNNSKLIGGDLKHTVTDIKRSRKGHNKNIMIYGSGTLVSALVQLGLVDEYQLWVHPVVLGKGKPLFGELKNRAPLDLIRSNTFGSGVVLLHYQVQRALTPVS